MSHFLVQTESRMKKAEASMVFRSNRCHKSSTDQMCAHAYLVPT